MDFILGLVLIILFFFYLLLFLLIKIISRIKILFGYKKYEYSKILSHGIKDVYMWHKNDEKALSFYKNYEFVSEIIPNKRRLKPKEKY